MKISFDLRLAALPGGGRVYARNLFPELVAMAPAEDWTIYHNPDCPAQRQIISQARSRLEESGLDPSLELQAVRHRTLSLRHHLEFRKFRDSNDLYHYLHFDMPLGMRNLPLVMTIHDLYPLTVENYCSTAQRLYFQWITKKNAQRSSRIITISNHSKKDIIERLGVPHERVAVIPQSCQKSFKPIENIDLLETLRKKYRLPERFIFYTGNHKKHKNLPNLIKSCSILPQKLRKEYPLVITGKITGESEKLVSLARHFEPDFRVIWAGWVNEEDLPGLYNLASLVVQPSFYEGFGLAPLEAMSCGTPVAASNATAIPEVVGDVGRLFDPCSIEDMTRAIQMALEKDVDNTELREKCLAQAARFSQEKTARETFAVYKMVVGGKLPV